MSMYVCRIFSSLVQLRLEAIPTNCIDDTVAIALDHHTLLPLSSACGLVFQQIVWSFPLLWHLKELFSRLILHRFYLVSRLRFTYA